MHLHCNSDTSVAHWHGTVKVSQSTSWPAGGAGGGRTARRWANFPTAACFSTGQVYGATSPLRNRAARRTWAFWRSNWSQFGGPGRRRHGRRGGRGGARAGCSTSAGRWRADRNLKQYTNNSKTGFFSRNTGFFSKLLLVGSLGLRVSGFGFWSFLLGFRVWRKIRYFSRKIRYGYNNTMQNIVIIWTLVV